MKIIDATSNAGRQIVPEDMNYLSEADREVVRGLEGLVKSLFGMSDGEAIVVSGCVTSYGKTSGNQREYRITNGVILYDGLLWEMEGLTSTGTFLKPDTDYRVVFNRQNTVEPSPVYGPTLVLDQSPHKQMVAMVRLSGEVPRGQESISLADLKRLPVIGTARGVNDDIINLVPVSDGD